MNINFLIELNISKKETKDLTEQLFSSYAGITKSQYATTMTQPITGIIPWKINQGILCLTSRPSAHSVGQASPTLLDMLCWRQKGSWHRNWKRPVEINIISGLSWTLKRNIVHTSSPYYSLYILNAWVSYTFIFTFISTTASLPPEAGKTLQAIPLWDRWPITWVKNGISLFIQFLKNICGDTSNSEFSLWWLYVVYSIRARRSERGLYSSWTGYDYKSRLEEVHCRPFHGGGRSQVYCL